MIDTLRAFAIEARRQAEALGMDPGPIEFRVASPDRIYELAANALPVRLRHWTHGRDYWHLKQQYERGAGRLYEIIFAEAGRHVAYLLEGNTLAAQKLVIAHCQGHADLDRHSLHLTGQAAYVEQIRLGVARLADRPPEALEWVLDRALALQDQVADTHPHHIPDPAPPSRWDALTDHREFSAPIRTSWPTPDLLGFIARESRHLSEWERDVCAVTRLEGLYFRQMGTCKLLHEAWATWANQRILLATDGVPVGEQIQTAALLARVITPSQTHYNPYALGYAFLDWLIAEQGMATVRTIWTTETDASLIRNWLTEDAVRALDLYDYTWTDTGTRWEAIRRRADWERIRDLLANELAPQVPRVVVEAVEGGELILRHEPDGTRCDRPWAEKATQAVADLWGAPVRFYDGRESVITAKPTKKPYDGKGA